MNLVPLIQSVIRGAWRRRIIMLMPLILIIPVACLTALLWPTKYETKALVLLQEYNGLSGDVPAYVRAQDMRDKVKSLEALITSEFILRSIIKKFHSKPDQQTEPAERDLREYRKRLSVEQVGTQFVQLTLTGGKNEGLGDELAAVLSALFESLLSSNDTSLDATSFVLRTRQRELQRLEARLKSLEALASSSPDTNLTEQKQALAAVETRVAELTPAFDRERQALDEALSTAAPDLSLAQRSASDIVTGLQRALDQLATDPTAKPINETERKTRISDLNELQRGAKNLVQISNNLRIARAEQRTRSDALQKAGSNISDRARWQREADSIRARYGQFERRFKDLTAAADIQLLRAPAQIQVIDTPKDPTRPRNSKLLILIGGVLAAFAMSGAFGFLAEQLDGSLRSPEMLRAATGVPIIANFAGLPSEHERPPHDRRGHLAGTSRNLEKA